MRWRRLRRRCSRSAFPNSVIPRSAGSRSRRCSSRSTSAIAAARVRLGLTTGVVYFTGTLYWITHVMAIYGDLPLWIAVLINAALIAYLALFPGVLRARRAPARDRARPAGAAGRAARVGGDRAGTDLHLHRLSVGAARLQPDDACCRSRSSRACSASTACRRWWRRSAPASRTRSASAAAAIDCRPLERHAAGSRASLVAMRRRGRRVGQPPRGVATS